MRRARRRGPRASLRYPRAVRGYPRGVACSASSLSSQALSMPSSSTSARRRRNARPPRAPRGVAQPTGAYDCDRDPRALPLVLMVDFGDRDVEPVPQPVDDRPDPARFAFSDRLSGTCRSKRRRRRARRMSRARATFECFAASTRPEDAQPAHRRDPDTERRPVSSARAPISTPPGGHPPATTAPRAIPSARGSVRGSRRATAATLRRCA